MKNSSVSDQTKSRFAEVVSNYAPAVPNKWQKLLALQTGIAELRHKRASYRTIVGILKNLDVSVSCTTVARFCQEVLGQAQPRNQNRSSMYRRSSTQIPRKSADTSNTIKTTTQGARVADPNTI